jgi:hypothetical protein
MTFGTAPPDRAADAVPHPDPTGDLALDLLRCGVCGPGVLRTAFAQVVVDWRGQLHPVWRHRDDQRPLGIGGDRDTSANRVA